MIRKTIMDSILQQVNADQSFENEALATFVEGEVTNRLLGILTEQDIQRLEGLKDPEIIVYLNRRVPELSTIISEEVQKAKNRFEIKK